MDISGFSSWLSLEAGPPPLTSRPAAMPSSQINTVQPVPASLFSGAIFLLLADLVARTLLSPIELSIGVVTSMVGAVAFVIIFNKTRKAR